MSPNYCNSKRVSYDAPIIIGHAALPASPEEDNSGDVCPHKLVRTSARPASPEEDNSGDVCPHELTHQLVKASGRLGPGVSHLWETANKSIDSRIQETERTFARLLFDHYGIYIAPGLVKYAM